MKRVCEPFFIGVINSFSVIGVFMKMLTRISGSLLTTLLIALPAQSENAKTEPSKDEALEKIDARISKLQGARDCIDAAQTKDAVRDCRAKMKAQRQKEREARKQGQ